MAENMDEVFAYLRRHHRAEGKLDFIDELEGFFTDHPEVEEMIDEGLDSRFVSVSFDRRRNDKAFDYHLFDILLQALDRRAGGRGVRKPVNQLRVIRWTSSRADLQKVLLSARRHFTPLKFRGLLILPLPAGRLGPGSELYGYIGEASFSTCLWQRTR